MKNKWLILILLLSLAMNLAAISTIFYHWFETRKFPPPPGAEFALDGPMNRLLRPSPEQLESIKCCRMRFHQEIRPLQEQIQGNRRQILELLMQPKIDTLQITALQDSVSGLQQKMQQKVVRHMIEQRQFLNENQYRVIFQKIGRRFMNPDDEFPPPGIIRHGLRNRKNNNE
jgi:hypothetical protein